MWDWGVVVGVVSEWDAGWGVEVELWVWEGGGLVYVVWIRSDFVWREKGLVYVVWWGLLGWVWRRGVERRALGVFFVCGVMFEGIGLCGGVGEMMWFGCYVLLIWGGWCVVW